MRKLYDGIMTAALLVKSSGNTELYRDLLDLSSEALNLQDEIGRLRNEVYELKKEKELDDKIERHDSPYITLKGDNSQIMYCSNCWGDEGKIIQMISYDSGVCRCTKCKTEATYDKEKKKEYESRSRISVVSPKRNNSW